MTLTQIISLIVVCLAFCIYKWYKINQRENKKKKINAYIDRFDTPLV